jgi:hypothetical protein
MALSKEDILATGSAKVEKIYVPEWGGEVYIRVMKSAERDAFEASALDRKGAAKMANIRARLAAIVLSDSEGKRLFTDADAPALGEKLAPALDRIFEAASKLNRLSKEDVEELEKNSESPQPGE